MSASPVTRRLARALFGACVVLLQATSAVAGDYWIDITNGTGINVQRLEVSHSSTSSWEENMLGRKELFRPGTTKRVTLNGYASPIFDVRLTDTDGDTYTFMGIDAERQDLHVTLAHLDRARETADEGYYVDVTNSTGYTIMRLQVSPQRSTSWEEDVLGSDVLPNGATRRIRLTGYSNPMFDVRATDTDGDTYTFMGVDVARSDVTIRPKDID